VKRKASDGLIVHGNARCTVDLCDFQVHSTSSLVLLSRLDGDDIFFFLFRDATTLL